ncbi:Conserved_hypothetical protein [Hexamita inflata]|uniref:Uncharacterized protein n=1 Tax=Hexamita inflata TaxID=28002 RepID=A0AA86Q2J1_9EUKA|nr:Conserved hypothetical protein [Hexamita inflata]
MSEFERLKEQILRKQEQVQHLDDKLIDQQKTIDQLNKQLQQSELEHKQTMAELQQKLNPDDTDALTDELKELRAEIQQKISLIEQRSDEQVKQAVTEAKTYQQHAYQTVKEKLEEREGMKRQQFRKSYIEQLQKEKYELEKELGRQKQLNEHKQLEIQQVEDEVTTLRQTLRQTLTQSISKPLLANTSNNSGRARITQQIEMNMDINDFEDSLQTIEQQQPNPTQAPQKKIHTKCQQEIESYNVQIKTLQKSIQNMKEDLKIVIQGTIETMRELGLLDSFYQNENIILRDETKRELCEKLSQNQMLVQSLIRMGQQKTQVGSMKLPLLKKDDQ